LATAEETKNEQKWSDSIYHTYASMINAAKAILLTEGLSANEYANMIEQFDETSVVTGKISLDSSFTTIVYQINLTVPLAQFAEEYYSLEERFYHILNEYREKEVVA